MKKIIFQLALLILIPYTTYGLKTTKETITTTPSAKEIAPKKTAPETDECANILGKIGSMVLSFIKILEQPNNKSEVYKNIRDMVEEFFNVGMCMMRSGPLRSHDEARIPTSNTLLTNLEDEEFVDLFIAYLKTDEGRLWLAYWRDLLLNETRSLKPESFDFSR